MAFLDIVVAGPDGSGTSTQVRDVIDYCQARGLKVADLRGDEVDALFHAERFRRFNHRVSGSRFESYAGFAASGLVEEFKHDFLAQAKATLDEGRFAACVDDPSFSFVDPSSIDVAVMEEPSRRAGLSVRGVQLHRSRFGMPDDQYAKAVGYAFDRECEFIRFRKQLRESGKVVLRSRGFESTSTYQEYDGLLLPNAPRREHIIGLPGNKLALQHPPTDIIVVHAPRDWSADEYLSLKGVRMRGRMLDDHEKDVEYQLLVNARYASDWLEGLYELGRSLYGAAPPRIHRIEMYDEDRSPLGKQAIRRRVHEVMDNICGGD
ncbi:hypothetical protein JXA12_00915 [Candidatus Woesearchaeota archaeon]|nr:hypothetical protein [Candidatus Woesearchaeota archaeon]